MDYKYSDFENSDFDFLPKVCHSREGGNPAQISLGQRPKPPLMPCAFCLMSFGQQAQLNLPNSARGFYCKNPSGMVKGGYMVKGFKQIAVITLTSRVFGLVRDMAYSYFLGASNLMDAWAIAFKLPNLARRLFGEGAASASFIPVYSEEFQNDKESAAKLANTVVTAVFVILAALVLFGWIVMWGYNAIAGAGEETTLIISLSSIMLPYALMVCLVAIFAGILNVHKHFAAPAAAPIVLNICIISMLVIAGLYFDATPKQQVFAVAFGVLIAGLIQITMQILPLRAKGITIRWAWNTHSDAFKKIMILMAPMIIGLTVTQLNTLADDLIAWFLSGSGEKGQFFSFFSHQIQYPLRRGSVSYLYYSQRLYQFPLGVLGISLATAIFPVMSAEAAKGDFNSLCKTISRGVKGAIFVAIPATVGLMLVGKTMVTVVFQRGEFTPVDTDMTSWTLMFYAIGLSGFFLQQILSRAFFSMQDSRTPMYSAIIAVVLNVALNLTLIWPLGTGGLALSTAICSYLQVIILIAILTRRFGKDFLAGFTPVLVKTIFSTAVMYLIGFCVMHAMQNLPTGAGATKYDILRLAAAVTACAAAYYIMAKIMKNEMLALFGPSKK